MFEDEIGSVWIIIESQSGGHPNEDMKMSSAPSFRGPGGHFFRCSSSRTVKTLMYSQDCAACSRGTTHAFVDLKVSN
jgi:hypothetical protein